MKTSPMRYRGICLIRHRLIRQFVTFSSAVSFVYISVHLSGHRLIRQFAQFVTSFYPFEAFCSSNTLFAVSLLMFKQLIQQVWNSNKLRIFVRELLHLAICLPNLTRGAKRDLTPH